MNSQSPRGALRRVLSFVFGAALFVVATPAQGGDPTEEIKELARQIDEQLQEIDRLLLESARSNQTPKAPREMLKEAAEKSITVQDGIDKLIEKLNEMKDQSGGSSSEDSQQQQQGQQQQQQQDGQSQPQNGGRPGQRRENQTPDFVQQPQQGQQPGEQQGQQQQPGEQQQQQQQQGQQPDGQQPGEQQQPQSGEGQPLGGQEQHAEGQNRTGQLPPDELGPGQPGTGEQAWGELQRYTNFLKNRGVTPKVADKYRKYYEAYLKQKQKGGK
ncbi:MAG: hypothetical protein H6835_18855 [Planctomycetes bacterium]|nr:hypothetical protein [Planctomycetota bacterium]